MGQKAKNVNNAILKRFREEIIPMFEKAFLNGQSAAFRNPHIVKCWETLDCKAPECAIFGSEAKEVRCWQLTGTYCYEKHQESFAEKYGKCLNCKAFKDSCPTIVEEIGEHFNNMVLLFNRQEAEILEYNKHIERLNKKLISALEQIEEQKREIQKMMITDRLTGLFNRHHLITVLENEVGRCKRYGHPLAIMIIDIDNLRSINDIYGQETGDAMLTYVGTLISENTRKIDRAFRYGGEEFVIVLPETDLTLAYIVAERIRKGFESKTFSAARKEHLTEYNISRTLSIGITSTYPFKTNDISIEELLAQTDRALYQAKSKGGNISIKYE